MKTKLLRYIRRSGAAGAKMMRSNTCTRMTAVALFAAAFASFYVAMVPPAQGVANSSRPVLGPETATAPVNVAVWLKLHDEGALDAAIQQMYDKSSPNYHHWLTFAQYKAQFAPTAQDAATARDYLTSNNFEITAVDPANHFIMAQGTVADAQRAFNTQINRVMVNGEVKRAPASKPFVTGAASAVVSEVQGLADNRYIANVKPAFDVETGKPFPGVSPTSAGPDGLFFSADCLRGVQTVTFTTNGGFPKATYTGTRYGADINNQPPNLAPCGYDAKEMETAYGLNTLISNGLDGTGQTIVIVDAFGSNTIRADANLFSQLNNLPPLTNQNFKVLKPLGPAHCNATNGCISGNWQFETTIDVEWAHAMAPGANIILVVSPDNSDANLDAANLFAIEHQLGSAISNSFGIPEIVLIELEPTELAIENRIAKLAAAMGISQNVSSGDAGDNLQFDIDFFGIPVASAGANDSAFVTQVGGTSTFLDNNNHIKLQTGWGLNFVRIADRKPNPPTIPPLYFGFQGGAGGGESFTYAKPTYQHGLPGMKRQTPDIAMDADPETGVEIIVTPDSVPGHPQEVDVFGGTSVACPMFSAVWAIANQAAGQQGHGLLGEAAPILYQLPRGAIIDVNVHSTGITNVTGTIFNPPSPPQHLSALALAAPEPPNQLSNQWISTLFHSPASTRWDVFTFGTDSSLTTGPGWDNVTGLGTPNGSAFINAVVAAAQ